MTEQRVRIWFPRRNVPQAYRLVIRARRNGLAIRRPGQGRYTSEVALEDTDAFPARRIPDSDSGVSGCLEQREISQHN